MKRRPLTAHGQPFPVATARVTERTLNHQFLGEGLVESEPVRVPIIKPSAGVKLIVVATLRPFRIAHMLTPLPR